MTSLFVNGMPVPTHAHPGKRLQEFIVEIRKSYNSEQAVISAILVDGAELNSNEEEALSEKPLSEIGSIEVFTAHPREIAEETLLSMIEFSKHLEDLSQRAARSLLDGQKPKEFFLLLDGIETFAEALQQVKGLMRSHSIEISNILEADLISILEDIVEFTEMGNRDYVVDLLQVHLPLNMQDWRKDGIPAIQKSRES